MTADLNAWVGGRAIKNGMTINSKTLAEIGTAILADLNVVLPGTNPETIRIVSDVFTEFLTGGKPFLTGLPKNMLGLRDMLTGEARANFAEQLANKLPAEEKRLAGELANHVCDTVFRFANDRYNGRGHAVSART